MRIGHIWVRTTPEDAVLTQQAAELFNALGESVPNERGDTKAEYSAEAVVVPSEGPDSSVMVHLGFLAANYSMEDELGWGECVHALRDAKMYLLSRPSV